MTMPISLRQKLGIKDGGKLAFIEENGKIIVANSTTLALLEAQKDFEGEAERLGLTDEQDVVDMVKEIRKERWERLYENND
jgi:bifunctional DNA-binding transcriptional regulator/antitoxin component of YhaV-PrlF toxin-antitoxin module